MHASAASASAASARPAALGYHGGETEDAQTRTESGVVQDRSIGEILRQLRHLTDEQVGKVVALQRERDLKFGEAAVTLGFVSTEDVLWALSQQFHYPYAAETGQKLNPELVVANQPFSQRAEAFRAIRSQLMMRLFNGQDPMRRALAVVSPDSGDGKTYFAANTAVAFSQLGARTLLIDADMRNPRQHQVFDIDNGNGLSGILSGREAHNVIHNVRDLPSLFVMPVGTVPPNPLELVERPAFNLLMRELLNKFDHIVVDTPAAVHGSDAGVIAAKCGAAIVIARKDRTRAAMLQEFVGLLGQSPARLGGVVMNEY
ncbi:polysaccharide biosynthesis tyrosine autokinase [Methylibium rhizosphaerae]|uniref:polysaccharide biosynthesis tyrosine autokinase n=1 Tax=Methylibium rhizosphaerae TaxID=2570323 RepID=UPI00112E6101|nr:polysaccharide biosynthesis tyrosine autokinase [Methylibium rhizosphaerae]